jgi:hypothetical protein
MLRRITLLYVLLALFAFTQIGMVTHEISHIQTTTQHTPDKHSSSDKCPQCLAYALMASGGAPTSAFVIHLDHAQFQLSTVYTAHLTSVLTAPYSARAPPASSII